MAGSASMMNSVKGGMIGHRDHPRGNTTWSASTSAVVRSPRGNTTWAVIRSRQTRLQPSARSWRSVGVPSVWR